MLRPILFPFLLLLIIILGDCRSQADRIRAQRNEVCDSIAPIPPRIPWDDVQQIKGRYYAPADAYNLWIDHAQGLAGCLVKIRCSELLAEWERDCAELRIDVLEASYWPGALYPRVSCPIPRPKCEDWK